MFTTLMTIETLQQSSCKWFFLFLIQLLYRLDGIAHFSLAEPFEIFQMSRAVVN